MSGAAIDAFTWLAGINAGDELPTNEHVLAQAAARADQQVAVVRDQPEKL